jgi:hypothetical protein
MDVYLRKIVIHNKINRKREVRLFFSHDFHIYGEDTGDTAIYEPNMKSIIHYKRQRYFLINGITRSKSRNLSICTRSERIIWQRFLQAISYEIYKDIILPQELQSIWEMLVYPNQFPKITINSKRINYFDVSEDWLIKRSSNLISEIDTIMSIDKTDYAKKEKIKSSRYLPTLKQIPLKQRQEMNEWLSKYKNVIASAKTIN